MLIDGILPFEACLYYQVLPLFLEGSRLNLGMVSPEDIPACEYVRRIVSYLNYSLVPRQISSEAVQVVLTAYLNHVGEKQSFQSKRQIFSYGHHRYSDRVGSQELTQNDRQTLIVDSPEDLNLPAQSAMPRDLLPTAPPQAALHPPDLDVTLPDVPVAGALSLNTAENTAEKIPIATMGAASLLKSLPPLEIQSDYLSAPVETLASLPPRAMLRELLGRVLVGGIGRLYFESHVHHGRVMWSQNGVLQSVLEKLPLIVFRNVLAELKQMARLSPQPVEQVKQVEIEYLYDRTRVLLRFRFMSGAQGEEATLQVLRGAALKFYQQQQVTKLERDAMG